MNNPKSTIFAENAGQEIFDCSIVLLNKFCRTSSGLNILASFYEDAAEGKISPHTLLQDTSDTNENFIPGCETILSFCKPPAAELNLRKASIQPSHVLPDDSKALKRLVDAFTSMMPNGALLVHMAFYMENKISLDKRQTKYVTTMKDARNQIIAAKNILKEEIPLVTYALMSELGERAKRNIKPETNSPWYASETREPLAVIMASLDSEGKRALAKRSKKATPAGPKI